MTVRSELDGARVALIRDRLGALLVGQPGAFENYKTAVQLVTPWMWCAEDRKTITNPEVVAWLAKHFWPDQPFSRLLADYYAISVAASVVAERPAVRKKLYEGGEWATDIFKRTGKTADSLPRLRMVFDDNKQKEAEVLLRGAAANIRGAAELLGKQAEARIISMGEFFAPQVIDEASERLPARAAMFLHSLVEALRESLCEVTFEGLTVPASRGAWKEFETEVAASLRENGIPPKRVVDIFKKVGDEVDPEDERRRIHRNMGRKRKT
ncbi:MAG: hypothetical protein SFV15_24965 [Polyangiaceae bacterium]|nr:hypothetical protein [Polyangiaceae bacterium]